MQATIAIRASATREAELRRWVEGQAGLRVVPEDASPDCRLVVHAPPEVDALGTLDRHDAAVVVVTDAVDAAFRRAALRAGAAEVVTGLDGLRDAVDDALARREAQRSGRVDDGEHRRLRQQLDQADLRLRAALTATEVGLWTWDPARDAVVADRNLARLFGLEIDEDVVPIAPFLDRMHPDDRPRVVAAIEHGLASGGVYDEVYRVVHADGQVRWLHARGLIELGPDGRPLSFPGIALDVTGTVDMAERLQEADDLYRALVASVDEGICLVDVLFDATDERALDYRFVTHNAAFEHQSGLRDVVGRTAREVVPGIDAFWPETYGRVARTGEPARFERFGPELGRWFEVEAVRVGAPERRRVAVLFRDVTARRASEAALREADRRKDEFIAILAHELRNPLAPVRNAVEILRRTASSEPTTERAREMIARQVSHMARLIDDLVDVSRIRRGKLALRREVCDLGHVVRQTAEDYRSTMEDAGLELVVDAGWPPLEVEGDPVRLAQMLGNLLQNAGRFTERGGKVEVRAERAPDGRSAQVRVTDDGVGILPGLLPHLFDPFSQADQDLARSKGGLGLGLALTKGLAELHDGTIEADSEGPGRGASFTLRLPLARTCSPLAGASADAPVPASLRVLLVEDHPDVARSMGELLELLGHQVELAFDGATGVTAARTFRPDVVISDIGLPGRLDGYGVARALRADPDLAATTLIAHSGYADELAVARAREAGFDRHLAKPVDVDHLERLLAGLARA